MRRLVHLATEAPLRWFAGYFVVTAALYAAATHLPLRAPIPIAPTRLDAAVPLLPWSALVYATYFGLMPSFLAATAGHPSRGRLRVAAAAVVLGNLGMNIAVPTALVRDRHPAEAHALLGLVTGHDTALAAFPSGHVSLPVALTTLAFGAGLAARWGYLAWAIALSASVLTTRQHYVPDVVGGVVWGVVGALLAVRGLPEDTAR